MSDVQCRMLDVGCRMSNVGCQVFKTLMPDLQQLGWHLQASVQFPIIVWCVWTVELLKFRCLSSWTLYLGFRERIINYETSTSYRKNIQANLSVKGTYDFKLWRDECVLSSYTNNEEFKKSLLRIDLPKSFFSVCFMRNSTDLNFFLPYLNFYVTTTRTLPIAVCYQGDHELSAWSSIFKCLFNPSFI